jgi:hypothetical protein
MTDLNEFDHFGQGGGEDEVLDEVLRRAPGKGTSAG